MIRRYQYIAKTESGDQTELDVHERAQSIANVEAKIEVERWLRDIGQTPDRLTQFDLVFVEPHSDKELA